MINTRAYLKVKQHISLPGVGKYVKKQMRDFLEVCEGKSKKFTFDFQMVSNIEFILKMINMPVRRGEPAYGKTAYECATAAQWAIFLSAYAIVYRDNMAKRRYILMVVEWARKNGKTATVAILYIIGFFIGEPGAEMFVAAPKKKDAQRVIASIKKILLASPKLLYLDKFMAKKRFKFAETTVKYPKYGMRCEALANSAAQAKDNASLEGLECDICAIDEVAGLKDSYTIDAMKKSHNHLALGGLTILISTKYPKCDNPFEEVVASAKRVLDGLSLDPRLDERKFALLYEPDAELIDGTENEDAWMTNDLILQQANPLATDNPAYMEARLNDRSEAVEAPEGSKTRIDFITKDCNMVYDGLGTDGFVPMASVQKCKVAKIDWTGRPVWVGIDLAQINDNAAVVMIGTDIENKIIVKPHIFIPADKIKAKTITEGVDYAKYIEEGYCTACGKDAISYEAIEKYIYGLKKAHGISSIMGITYDRYDASYLNMHLSAAGYTTYRAQYSDAGMTPPTQFLKAQILNGKFEYEENPLLEMNFYNTRCKYTGTMGARLDKKTSRGKIDMVMALVYAVMGVMKLNETMPKVTTGDVIVKRNTAMQGW